MIATYEYTGDIVGDILRARGITDEFDRSVIVNQGESERSIATSVDIMRINSHIKHSIGHNKRVLIIGDYDADGICAGVMAKIAIPNSDLHIPERKEGYGLNDSSYKHVKPEHDLLLTVDCGIRSGAIVDRIVQIDAIEAIVTDHHQVVRDDLPRRATVIHPELSSSPFTGYSGSGVIYKVLSDCGIDNYQFVQLAAIGTICDVMPMLDENRKIVRDGLRMINHRPMIGVKALVDVLGKDIGSISETDIGFYIGPMINACGRMGNANLAKELLLCRDESTANKIAIEVNALNTERKEAVKRMTIKATESIVHCGKIVISVIEDNQEGLIGLLAMELQKIHRVPAFVFSVNGDKAIGSCRGPVGFDCGKLTSVTKKYIVSGGGHAGAAGMTVLTKNLNDLIDAIVEYVDNISFIPQEEFRADISIPIEEVTAIVEDVELLRPFGQRFEAPVFASVVRDAQVKPIGKTGNHNKITTEYGIDIMLFGIDNDAASMYNNKDLRVAYELLQRGKYDRKIPVVSRHIEVIS